ncbi:SGNH/GDSL hydrolase family protein [Vitiosangium sp. GDMCC 1.1324]|uniref:SGNH/GDSL hydrolase family protein n=1 Tax=Vitiosangium sp. (strain GDMCC 1.1324) TaxID=2138576 RepID=UPI000D3AC189|nr:SGNH/GDSL hydrolase family protein [Vitiosangium sp. GDMCC 1.1324]PTL83792.1 lipase [Vitiosangium sp. GDMCC 1.1324]
MKPFLFCLLAVLTLTAALIAPTAHASSEAHWVGTWTASQQAPWGAELPLPTGVPATLSDQTLRQFARVSVGGTRVRIVLSNEYGTRPVTVGPVHLARAHAKGGSAIVASAGRTLTFDGQPEVTIPAGGKVVSEPVELAVPALSTLAVSLFLPGPAHVHTFHWDGRQTAYLSSGNVVGAPELSQATSFHGRILLSEVQVDAPVGTRVVVALGDSITEGNGSTPDANRRWPDFLAERLAAERVAVLNAGISGGRLLADGMGVSALARFERDVLSQPQVRTVVVLMGINDISWPRSSFAPNASVPTAERIIAGYRELISRAHARGVRIVGATLPPFNGALEGSAIKGYFHPSKERVRQAVNAWIRSSREFDGVADFDARLRDPARPDAMLPAYDSGDHLHPGDRGYQTMAETFDLKLLFGN